MKTSQAKAQPLYIVLISIHGLIRGYDLELGRDEDTGGQTKYLVELARALVQQQEVARIDLLTRLINAPEISSDYAQPFEDLGNGARIVRIEAGPRDYIAKEHLWDHLDSFSDNALEYLRTEDRLPDVIHSHYADAGYVGSQISHQLGIPLVHTGHSLGRVKRRQLLAAGLSGEDIESRFNMTRRIDAEEFTLATAERVITSTHQEIEEQYGLYDHYQPDLMRVIPPGTDLHRFHPPYTNEWPTPIGQAIHRFLDDTSKPVILALSRPDRRKNIGNLIAAYGESEKLQALANLVIIVGNRDDIDDLNEGAREIVTEILLSIDRYDLYGKVAIPKQHRPDDVPVVYRIAAASEGVFVNPALTEPFGLTLIEAAASGLPIVATEEGGPRDIIANCKNGLLVDPLDTHAISATLIKMLTDNTAWHKRAMDGLHGVREHYSWGAHARDYLQMLRPMIDRTEVLVRAPLRRRPMMYHDRAIFSDIDQNLLSDPSSLSEFIQVIKQNRHCATFGIATGRRMDSALKVIKKNGIPEPDVLISSGGTQIHYAPELTEDSTWVQHIDHNWTPSRVRRALDGLSGLQLQPKAEQSRFKISYYIDPHKAPSVEELTSLINQEELSVNLTLSFGQFLDILPIRASKGLALRYFADRWSIPLEHVLVAGGSGADEDMMRGNTLAVVVGNRHHEELSQLIDLERIYFAEQSYAQGILEAIDHYDFYGTCNVPQEEHNLT